MTLRELAELMQRLGASQAMNLDGGGSSEMVVNGLTASRPSTGGDAGSPTPSLSSPAPTASRRAAPHGRALPRCAGLTADVRGSGRLP
jgi:hypothetical protein